MREKPPIFRLEIYRREYIGMKRTAEELIALRAKREPDDKEKDREARRRSAGRAKRRKMRDGDLVEALGLTTAEMRGLVLDAPGRRERWARLGSGRAVREVPEQLPETPPAAEAAD
jgi:hypothetical protein